MNALIFSICLAYLLILEIGHSGWNNRFGSPCPLPLTLTFLFPLDSLLFFGLLPLQHDLRKVFLESPSQPLPSLIDRLILWLLQNIKKGQIL